MKHALKTTAAFLAVLMMLISLTGCANLFEKILGPIPGEATAAPTTDPGPDADATETPAVPEVTAEPEPTPTPEPEMPPAPLAFNVGWESPASTGYMMCGAVSKTGELWVFSDRSGNGYGIDYEVVSEQEPVSVMNGVASVWGAGAYLLALKTNGTLWFLESVTKEPFMIADGVSTADGGGEISAFIRFDGSLYLVKNCDLVRKRAEAPLTKLMENAASVSCGGEFLAAIKTDGTLWTWGSNDRGQIGDGTSSYRSEPVKIMDNVKCVDCADSSAVAVTNDGSVFVWGDSGLNTSWEPSGHYYKTPTFAMSGVLSAVCSESYGRTLLIMKDTGSLWLWSTTPEANGGGFASNSFLLMDGCEHFGFGGGILLLVKDDGQLYVGGYYSHSQNGKFSVLCGDVCMILEDTSIPGHEIFN